MPVKKYKIWAIIKETGYTPNQVARDLKLGREKAQNASAGAIACILGRTKTLGENPFFEQMARVIEQQAIERGYPVRLSYSIFDMHSDAIQNKDLALKVDGAIVLGRVDDTAVKLLERYYKNIVYVGRNKIKAGWDQVICDGYEATQIAIGYLISLGHQKIGYIGETLGEVRYQAYSDMVHKYRLNSEKRFVCESRHNGDGGYQGADLLLKSCEQLPTAVFCTADVSAIAALRCFTESAFHHQHG